MMVLIISGCAAATAIGYVGRYGEKKMTWQPTCGYVSKYCNRMSISLAFSYLAFFAYLLLTFTSALTLMSRPTTQWISIHHHHEKKKKKQKKPQISKKFPILFLPFGKYADRVILLASLHNLKFFFFLANGKKKTTSMASVEVMVNEWLDFIYCCWLYYISPIFSLASSQSQVHNPGRKEVLMDGKATTKERK